MTLPPIPTLINGMVITMKTMIQTMIQIGRERFTRVPMFIPPKGGIVK